MQASQFINLEIIILKLLKNNDLSSEQLYQFFEKYFTITEGELLTTLFFLYEMDLISINTSQDTMIYHIEEAGCVRYTTLKREYQNIYHSMEDIFQNEKNKI